MNPYPIKFIPIPKKRVWGGEELKEWFKYTKKGPIGEYWVLSAHPNGMSVVSHGELKGKTLQELTEEYPQFYLGNSPQSRFPLLIKFLDITQDLSVQVHPEDSYAQEHEEDFGKTECWYILNSKEKGSIIYGHNFNTKEDYYKAIKEKKVKDHLNYVPIKPHQAVLVPARTLHALLADTSLIEIQQTSDVTYRVYDWDRIDHKGNTRELHVDRAGDVLNYESSNDYPFQESILVYQNERIHHEQLIRCPYFTVERLKIADGKHPLSICTKSPDILIIAKGSGWLHDSNQSLPLHFGDTILCPFNTKHHYQLEATSELHALIVKY